MYLQDMQCCGMREIDNLSGIRHSEDAMLEFLRESEGDGQRFRYAVFSEAGTNAKYGDNFRQFIEKNDLGSVIFTSWNKNPNTGNRVRAYIWTINWTALNKWGKANGITSERDEDSWL
jgi:hypothetical protein